MRFTATLWAFGFVSLHLAYSEDKPVDPLSDFNKQMTAIAAFKPAVLNNAAKAELATIISSAVNDTGNIADRGLAQDLLNKFYRVAVALPGAIGAAAKTSLVDNGVLAPIEHEKALNLPVEKPAEYDDPNDHFDPGHSVENSESLKAPEIPKH